MNAALDPFRVLFGHSLMHTGIVVRCNSTDFPAVAGVVTPNDAVGLHHWQAELHTHFLDNIDCLRKVALLLIRFFHTGSSRKTTHMNIRFNIIDTYVSQIFLGKVQTYLVQLTPPCSQILNKLL